MGRYSCTAWQGTWGLAQLEGVPAWRVLLRHSEQWPDGTDQPIGEGAIHPLNDPTPETLSSIFPPETPRRVALALAKVVLAARRRCNEASTSAAS